MKKVRLFAFLFFAAAAVILFQSTTCDDSVSSFNGDTKIVCTNKTLTVDKDGIVTVQFNAMTSATDISRLSFNAQATGGKIVSASSQGKNITVAYQANKSSDSASTPTTKADAAKKNNIGSLTVNVTGAVLTDNRVIFLNRPISSTVDIEAAPVDEDPEDPDEPIIIVDDDDEDPFVGDEDDEKVIE
jgi:hypothetical protein